MNFSTTIARASVVSRRESSRWAAGADGAYPT